MKNKESESWIKQYWRPFMAWQYAAVCIFDFLLAPIFSFYYFHHTGTEYIPWDPLTLKESGFYHLAMAAIIGVAAWTRGQEKIKRIASNEQYQTDVYETDAYGNEGYETEKITTTMTPIVKNSRRGKS